MKNKFFKIKIGNFLKTNNMKVRVFVENPVTFYEIQEIKQFWKIVILIKVCL